MNPATADGACPSYKAIPGSYGHVVRTDADGKHMFGRFVHHDYVKEDPPEDLVKDVDHLVLKERMKRLWLENEDTKLRYRRLQQQARKACKERAEASREATQAKQELRRLQFRTRRAIERALKDLGVK